MCTGMRGVAAPVIGGSLNCAGPRGASHPGVPARNDKLLLAIIINYNKDGIIHGKL